MNRFFTLTPTGTLCALLLGTAPTVFGGINHIQAPKGGMTPKEVLPPKAVTPPPPYVAPKDCDGCVEPGFYLSASLLYLHAYNSDIDEFDGEWDAGFRGQLGWESANGLFVEFTGMYHETDYSGANGVVNGSFEFFYLDATVGDTIHCGELCLAVSGGLRYSHFEFNEDWGGMNNDTEFDGVGPVFNIEATRAVHPNVNLYANIRQSLLFGESDYIGFKTDTLASVTEIGGGLEWKFDLGSFSNTFVRAGIEGQYWHVDSASIGLLGGVLSVGSHF